MIYLPLMLAISAAQGQSPLPEWASARWEAFAKAHALSLSSRITPTQLQGDFDGDGKQDVALLVENIRTHTIGIVFIHRAGTAAYVVGAGTPQGNGGDDFEWMDHWSVKAPAKGAKRDAILAEHESSASGLIYFEGGRYRWKQQGD